MELQSKTAQRGLGRLERIRYVRIRYRFRQ